MVQPKPARLGSYLILTAFLSILLRKTVLSRFVPMSPQAIPGVARQRAAKVPRPISAAVDDGIAARKAIEPSSPALP